MADFYDNFKKKVFDDFVDECQKVFKYFYPAVNVDENGFTEAPLISSFFASIRTNNGPLTEAVWWDEFPLPNDIRFSVGTEKRNSNHLDALLYEPKTKSVLMIEAKNGRTKLGNVVEIVEDIIRMANVANNPSVLADHFWSNPDKHSPSDSFDLGSFGGLYGMNLFWFWDNSGATISSLEDYISSKIGRFIRFRHTRNNAYIDAQKEDLCIKKTNLYIREIDIGYPGIEYRCYVCCYLWKHESCSGCLLDSNAKLERSGLGINAILSIVDNLVCNEQINKLKVVDTEQSLFPKYIYLWPRSFEKVMTNRSSYAKNKRQVWIDLTGGRNSIALVVIDKSHPIYSVPEGWTIQNGNHRPYSLGNNNGAIYHLGQIEDLNSDEGLDRLQQNMWDAFNSLNGISFS